MKQTAYIVVKIEVDLLEESDFTERPDEGEDLSGALGSEAHVTVLSVEALK